LFEALAIDILQAVQSIQAAALLLRIDCSQAQAIMKRALGRGLHRRRLDERRHVGIEEKDLWCRSGLRERNDTESQANVSLILAEYESRWWSNLL